MPKDHWLKVLIYWPSGSGKTVFAWTAKDALFLSAERWLLSIKDTSPEYIDIKTFEDLQKAFIYLSKWGHKYKTVIIDSITEINEIIKSEIEKRNGHFMAKSDWWELQNKIEDVLHAFHDLPMHVIFIAQEQSEKDEDKTTRILPSLNWKTSTKVASLMDVVAYMTIEKNGKRKIVTNSNSRLLTKDRTNTIWDNAEVDFEKRIIMAQSIKIWEETVVLSEDIEVPEALPEKEATTSSPDDITRWLRSEVWNKMLTKRDKAKASIIFSDWLKNIYCTDRSTTLSIDQLHQILWVLNDKGVKEIEDMVTNHDARAP